MNSLKSLCRCAKRAPMAFDQLEQQVQPFLGCQVGIELIVGLVGSIKAGENLRDALHDVQSTRGTTGSPGPARRLEPRPPPRGAPAPLQAPPDSQLERERRAPSRVGLPAPTAR